MGVIELTTQVFVTVKEFSKISGIGINRLYELCNLEEFPSIRSGRLIKIHKEKAIDWLGKLVEESNKI